MMDLDSAIQHCREQVQEQAKKGCYSCAEEHRQLAEWLKELKAYREQNGDAISRAKVYEMLRIWLEPDDADRMILHFDDEIPSVSPQQKVGRWLKTSKAVMGEGYMWYCNNCEYEVYQDSSRYPSEKFCPNCGAKMEGAKMEVEYISCTDCEHRYDTTCHKDKYCPKMEVE